VRPPIRPIRRRSARKFRSGRVPRGTLGREDVRSSERPSRSDSTLHGRSSFRHAPRLAHASRRAHASGLAPRRVPRRAPEPPPARPARRGPRHRRGAPRARLRQPFVRLLDDGLQWIGRLDRRASGDGTARRRVDRLGGAGHPEGLSLREHARRRPHAGRDRLQRVDVADELRHDAAGGHRHGVRALDAHGRHDSLRDRRADRGRTRARALPGQLARTEHELHHRAEHDGPSSSIARARDSRVRPSGLVGDLRDGDDDSGEPDRRRDPGRSTRRRARARRARSTSCSDRPDRVGERRHLLVRGAGRRARPDLRSAPRTRRS